MALVISKQTVGLWLLFDIYASTDYKEKRVLWFDIIRMAVLGLASLFARDFIYIMGPHEKMGGR